MTREQFDIIKAEIEKGTPTKEIAELLNVKADFLYAKMYRVKNTAKFEDLKIKKGKPQGLEPLLLSEESKAMSIEEIAYKCGCGISTVHTYIRKLGLKSKMVNRARAISKKEKTDREKNKVLAKIRAAEKQDLLKSVAEQKQQQRQAKDKNGYSLNLQIIVGKTTYTVPRQAFVCEDGTTLDKAKLELYKEAKREMQIAKEQQAIQKIKKNNEAF